jgi:hypothetical protein
MFTDRRSETERVGMRLAWEYEIAQGRRPENVSRGAGAPPVGEHVEAALRSYVPDLLRRWSADIYSATHGGWRLIEVKARSTSGPVEVTNREYQTGRALNSCYWLYVVWDALQIEPYLVTIQDPMRLAWKPTIGSLNRVAQKPDYQLDVELIRAKGMRVWPCP